jgi:hypothetical protein
MSVTERQVANAVGLIIAGAMSDVDNGNGTASAIFFAVASELSDWLEGEPDLFDTIFMGGNSTTESRYEMLFAHITPDAARQIAESIRETESADDETANVLVRQLEDIK